MRRTLPLLFVLALLLPACGGTLEPDVRRATLVLDGAPAAVHAGAYVAVAREFDRGEGATLRIRAPRPGSDPVRQLETGRAQLALLGIDELAAASDDVVGVMALVQAPLVGVLSDARRPRELEGERVAVATGTTSARASMRDLGLLRAVVDGDGGDPAEVRAVPAEHPASDLTDGRVAGAVARWDLFPDRDVLRPDDYGAPTFPGLVLATTRRTLTEQPDLIRATIAALRRGYDEAIRDPELAVETLMRDGRARDRAALLAQLRAVSPAFREGGRRFGTLDPAVLEQWAAWAAKYGVVARKPDVAERFVTRFSG